MSVEITEIVPDINDIVKDVVESVPDTIEIVPGINVEMMRDTVVENNDDMSINISQENISQENISQENISQENIDIEMKTNMLINKNVIEIRLLAKNLNIVNSSKYKKSELINLILEMDSNLNCIVKESVDLNLDNIENKLLKEIKLIAKTLNIKCWGKNKDDLIEEIKLEEFFKSQNINIYNEIYENIIKEITDKIINIYSEKKFNNFMKRNRAKMEKLAKKIIKEMKTGNLEENYKNKNVLISNNISSFFPSL